MREVNMEEKNETPETQNTPETEENATSSEADTAKAALAEALAENAKLTAELAVLS